MRYLLILFIVSEFFAQETTINLKGSTGACSYYGENINNAVSLTYSSDEARTIIEEIVSIVGLKPNFEIRSADIPNAAAVNFKNKRYILYNPRFVDELNKSAKSRWASVSILAHEIGHHLN